jgi:hypothetical protein
MCFMKKVLAGIKLNVLDFLGIGFQRRLFKQLDRLEFKINKGMSDLQDTDAALDQANVAITDLATDAATLASQVQNGTVDQALAAQVKAKAEGLLAAIRSTDAAVEAADGVVTPEPTPEPAPQGFKPAGQP